MILAVLVSLIISIVILSFLLKKKPGERFSKKTVWRFVLFGALSLIVPLALSMVFPINPDTFSHLNPLLGGFLASLLTAALAEELIKYFFFRMAVRKNAEVRCWLDAIIAWPSALPSWRMWSSRSAETPPCCALSCRATSCSSS